MQECLLKATQLLGRVAHAEQNKDALREAGAVVALLKLLRPRNVDPPLAEAVCQALTILAVNNEINQDYIRSAAAGPAATARGEGGCSALPTLAARDAIDRMRTRPAVAEFWEHKQNSASWGAAGLLRPCGLPCMQLVLQLDSTNSEAGQGLGANAPFFAALASSPSTGGL